jgi:hypothetical protein
MRLVLPHAVLSSKDDSAHDMQRLLKLPATQKITKKYLRETMTTAQYSTALAGYSEKLRQVLAQDVPDFDGAGPDNGQGSRDHDSPRDTIHTTDVVGQPSEVTGSNVLPEGSMPAEAKAKLRAEAIRWGIQASEIEHVITHHPLDRARTLLWQARRPKPRHEFLAHRRFW